MTSALLRRREARERLIEAHLAREDLVWFEDSRPVVEMVTAICRDGRIVRSAEARVAARRIADGRLRLITLTGLGDAIWTRGVLRETLRAGLEVYLDTPFEWVFWDFVGQERFHFWRKDGAPRVYGMRTATYLGRDLRDGATVYGAMCERCKVARGDFRLALKPEWLEAADRLLERLQPRKPLMLVRPLLRNHGRRSVSARNPDPAAYGAVAASIIGAGVAGAVVAYKRLYGRREDAAVADDCYRDLSRKLESLASRVELLESSIRSLPTAANVLDLVKSLNEVDRRLAKIEGYVMGKQALAD